MTNSVSADSGGALKEARCCLCFLATKPTPAHSFDFASFAGFNSMSFYPGF